MGAMERWGDGEVGDEEVGVGEGGIRRPDTSH